MQKPEYNYGWGTLNAVVLNSGELIWKITLGQFPELAAMGVPNSGTQLFGGGIITAGSLIAKMRNDFLLGLQHMLPVA